MSKKTFKKACGKLFKEGKVVLTKRGVKLAKADGDSLETKADKGGFKKKGDREPLRDKRYDPKTGTLRVRTRAENEREQKPSWKKTNSDDDRSKSKAPRYTPNPRKDRDGDEKKDWKKSSSSDRRKSGSGGGRSKFGGPKSGGKSGGKGGSWKKSSGSSDRGRSKRS